MMSYTITSKKPVTLNDILITLKAWKAEQGRMGATDEGLFTEALDRLEFLQERKG